MSLEDQVRCGCGHTQTYHSYYGCMYCPCRVSEVPRAVTCTVTDSDRCAAVARALSRQEQTIHITSGQCKTIEKWGWRQGPGNMTADLLVSVPTHVASATLRVSFLSCPCRETQ